MKELEMILKLLGSKKPFLQQERITETGDIQVLSKQGEEAYENLMYLLYKLEYVGALKGANEVIDKLDKILYKE